MLQIVGLWIAPLIIFVIKRESRFVSFHALQALLLQVLYLFLMGLGIVFWFWRRRPHHGFRSCDRELILTASVLHFHAHALDELDGHMGRDGGGRDRIWRQSWTWRVGGVPVSRTARSPDPKARTGRTADVTLQFFQSAILVYPASALH
jgi:uncharacterized membrane protein